MRYVNISELEKLNGIYISNINVGMEEHLCYILQGSKEQHYKLLVELGKLNEPDGSYVDFYYKRIDDSNINLIRKHLTEEENCLLDTAIEKAKETKEEEEFIITELTKENLKLFLSLSYQELLFSSFYFTHLPCTIWSNYRGRFVLFAKEQRYCDKVLELAKEIGLLIDK